MFFYCFVFCFVSLLAYYADRNHYQYACFMHTDNGYPNLYIASLIYFLLVFIAGFRYDVGVDFFSYFYSFNSDLENVILSIKIFKEPGIRILSFVSRKLIFDNGISLIFTCSSITIFLYLFTIYKYSKSFAFCVILYMLMGEWHGSFNGIRQYIASAILFFGHRYILDRKFKEYIFIVIIASCFHITALTMLLTYWILNRRINLYNILLLLIVSIFIRYSYSYFFDIMSYVKNQEMHYEDYAYYSTSVNIFRVLSTFAPLVICYFFCENINKTSEGIFYINCFVLNFFMHFAFSGSAYATRLCIYTIANCIISYDYMIKLLKTNVSKKNIKLIICICYFLYWIVSLYATGSIPYKCYFQFM